MNATHIGTIDFETTGALTQDSGTLAVGAISGTVGGAVSLALTGNTVTGIGSLSAGGSIDIENDSAAAALVASGPVVTTVAGDVTLISPTLSVTGVISPTDGNILLSTDRFGLSGGISDAGHLVALAPFTAGGSLVISSASGITASTVRLGSLDGSSQFASSIAFTGAGNFGTGTVLELDTSGAVTQTSGATLSAGTLTGTAGSVTLDQGNAILTLGSFASIGAFTLIDAAPTLTVTGPVSVADAALLTLGAARLTIDAGTFGTAGVSSGGGVLLQTNALDLGTITGTAVSATTRVAVSTFDNTAAALILSGTGVIQAPTLVVGGDGTSTFATSLNLGALGFTGTLLDLLSLGGIDQTGALQLGTGTTLAGAASGNVVLGDTANAIGLLGNLTSTGGNLTLVDADAVTTTGSIGASGTLSISDSAATSPAIQIGADSVLKAATVALTTTGAISGAAIDTALGNLEGVVSAGLLRLDATSGDVALGGNANTITALGQVTLGAGSFSLTDSRALQVTGSVDASAAITLLDTAAAGASAPLTIAAGGELAASDVSLSTTATGIASTATAIDEVAGGVISGTLSGSTESGNVALLGTANVIGALGNLSAGTGIAAGDTITVLDTGTLSLAGTLAAGRISLAAGTLAYQSGALNAGSLIELAPLTATGLVLGPLAGGGNVDPNLLANSSATLLRLGEISGRAVEATSITIPGSVAIGATTLDLETTGSIGETGALLFAGGTISGNAGHAGGTDSVALTGANDFATLGAFTLAGTGTIAVTDTAAMSVGTLSAQAITLTGDRLTLTGPLTAPSLTLNTTDTALAAGTAAVSESGVISTATLSGSVASGDMGVAVAGNSIGTIGALSVSGGTLTLDDGAALVETAASTLRAGSLGGVFARGADLSAGSNTVNAIGNLAMTTGSLALVNTGVLAVTGPVSATADAAGTIALSTTGTLQLGGAVAASQRVSILANGMTEATGGSLAAVAANGAVEIAPETAGVLAIGSGRGVFFAPAALASVSATTLRLGEVTGQTAASATGIDFAASTSIGTATLDLQTGGLVSEPAAAALSLTHAGGGLLIGATGDVQLLGTGNSVARLGPYTVTGGSFQLADSGALSVVGNVTAANVTLAVAGALSIDTGSLLASGGVVDLTATSGTEDATGTIVAATLLSSGTPSGAFDLSGANQIGALGAWNGPVGTLTLRDAATTGLAITGAVATGTLDVSSAGTISESAAGSIAADVLLSSRGATGANFGSANAVGTLDGFSVGSGAFALDNGTTTLTVGGTVTAASIALTSQALLTIGAGGVLQAPGGSVDLLTAGATETGSGIVNAGTLLGSQSLAGDFILTGANSVDTLGAWTTAGALDLVDPGAVLRETGPVTASALTLSAGTIQLTGDIAATTVSFTGTAGGATQSGSGTLDVGTVTAGGTGLTLGAALNTIVTLGVIAVGNGGVAVTDQTALGVTGPVSATGGTISLTSASDITVSGAVTSIAGNGSVGIKVAAGGSLGILDGGSLQVPTGSLDLTAAGASQSGSGFIAAGTLFSSGLPSGTIALTGTANVVGNLGSFAMTGGALQLTDSTLLTVGNTGRVADLVLTAPTIAVAGTLNGGTVDLTTTAGGVREIGTGTVLAGLLTSSGNVVGGVTLTSTNDVVGTLGAFVTTGGDFSLTSKPSLSVDGIVSAPDIIISVPGSLAIADGGALVTSGFIDLTAGNASESGSGHIQTGTLQSAGGLGNTILSGPNTIDVLGRFTGNGTLSLTDAVTLTVAGPVTVPSVTLAAPGLIFAGDASGTLLDLEVGVGGVSQTGGTIAVGTLTGTVAGTTTLGDRNAIVDLGAFTGTGAVAITDARGLTITGLVDAPAGITFGVTGTLSEAGLGTLVASTLGGSATGAVTLKQTANAVAALSFAGSSTLSLVDSENLDISGPLSATAVTLSVTGNLTESGGPITTATFAGTATNMTLLAANRIASLGTITVPGAFKLLDARSFGIAGAVTAGTIDLSTTTGNVAESGTIRTGLLQSGLGIGGSVNLTNLRNSLSTIGNLSVTGSIDYASNLDPVIDGAVVAPGGLTIDVAGALTEIGRGSITTSALRGQALGGATLAAAANAIDTIAFSTGGADLTLTDGVALVITGPLIGRVISITDPAGVTEVNGSAAAGAIEAALFNATGSNFSLTGDNQVAALGNVTTPGALVLVNAAPLDVVGTVNATSVDLSTLTGGVTESGAIVTGTLSSGRGIAGAATLAGAGNQIATVGNIQSGGDLEIADTVAMNVAGTLVAPVVDLSTTAGGIGQSAGAIVTGVLDSSFGIAGDASFAQAGNQITTLGQMPVTGNLALADATGLGVSGPVSAANFTLVTPGDVGVVGNVVVPGTLTTETGGSIVRSGGALVVGTLTGTAAGRADFGTAANVGTIDSFTVNNTASPGTFAIANAQPLTTAGTLNADYLSVSSVGELTLGGDLVTLGLPLVDQVGVQPTLPGSSLAVVADANGGAVVNQIGTTQIIPRDGPVATLRIDLPATGGQMVFNNLSGPSAELILFTGPGTATGQINVGDLFVFGGAGATNLTGTVSGLNGSAAARASLIAPQPNTNYRINGCPIRSVNCILLPLATVAPTDPLQDLTIGQARDDEDDDDVLLPNVSDKDY